GLGFRVPSGAIHASARVAPGLIRSDISPFANRLGTDNIVPIRTLVSVLGSIRILLALIALSFSVRAQTNQSIYTDTLQNGWESWGWTEISFTNASPVHGGTKSISVTVTQAWQAIYLHYGGAAAGTFTNISFWANGGVTGGQQLEMHATVNTVSQTPVSLAKLPTNTWQQFTVTLASLGVTAGSAI